MGEEKNKNSVSIPKDRNGQLLILIAMVWLTLATYVWHSWSAKEACPKSPEPAKEKKQ